MMCLLDSCFLKKQVLYFHCSNLTMPSKFLARDPISDCCSRSRRRRASSRCCWPLNRHRGGGVPVQRVRCTYLLFPSQLQNIQMTPRFINGYRKKWVMKKYLKDSFEVYFLNEAWACKWPLLPTNNASKLTFRNFLMDHSNSKLFFGLWTPIHNS